MAAQIEEIVVDPDVVDLQQFGPNQGQGLLGLGLWPDEGMGGLHVLIGRDWQCFAVDLPVWSERQLLQPHNVRGDHVVRQLFGQVGAHFGYCQRVSRSRSRQRAGRCRFHREAAARRNRFAP